MTDHSADGTVLEAEPTTESARELAALPTWMTTVVAADDLSPTLRRVVLGGAFDGFGSHGGDQFVYAIVPRDGAGELPDGFVLAGMTEHHTAAYYTIRRWDPIRRQVELWMVRHGRAVGVGAWAERCRIGERVALWGPRRGAPRPPDATRHLLLADDSGLAAVAARLEELPAGHTALVLAETLDPGSEVKLTDDLGVEVRWSHRHAEEPGTGHHLLRALGALGLEHQDLSDLSVFGAGERTEVAALRRHLRRQLRIPATHVHLTAYWQRGGW